MRIVLVSALLGLIAACVAPPPPEAAIATAPAAAPRPFAAFAPAPVAAPPPAASAVVLAPAPTPVVTLAYEPLPLPDPGTFSRGVVTKLFGPDVPTAVLGSPPAGRLTLSNFIFDLADVEALVTPYPDCAVHPGLTPMDFKLPLNSTWIIPAPPGSNICWRRQLALPPVAAARGTAPAVPTWAEWNRAYTASGRYIDSQL